jgi:hypothetical protein
MRESRELREEVWREPHAGVWRLYQRLLAIRREELSERNGEGLVHARVTKTPS